MNDIINPPEFRLLQGALGQTFRDYVLDDPRIKDHDVVSLFTYIRDITIHLMQQNPNAKVYLNLRANMAKINNGKEEVHTFYSGVYEIFSGTNLEEALRQMRDKIFERFSMPEEAEGSDWIFRLTLG